MMLHTHARARAHARTRTCTRAHMHTYTRAHTHTLIYIYGKRYAQNHLADSVLRTNWNAQDRIVAPNQAAWDSGVLMDPGRDSYKAEMVAQTARRLQNIPHFQGVVVDRSDYARFYNLEHDDGVTLTTAPNTQQSWSLKRSYLDVIAGIRGVLKTDKVMLMNSLGYSSISFMKDIDGTFSEGKAFNAVGILGAGK